MRSCSRSSCPERSSASALTGIPPFGTITKALRATPMSTSGIPVSRRFSAAKRMRRAYEQDRTATRTRRSVPVRPLGSGTNWSPSPASTSPHHRRRSSSKRRGLPRSARPTRNDTTTTARNRIMTEALGSSHDRATRVQHG